MGGEGREILLDTEAWVECRDREEYMIKLGHSVGRVAVHLCLKARTSFT